MKYLIVLSLLFGFSTSHALAADKWMSEYKFKSHTKKMKRNKMRPTSVTCRSKSTASIKPELKASWAPDSGKKEWALYHYKGLMEWRPGHPSTWKQWRRVSNKVLVGKGGAKYRCALFYKK
ncbi:MAG: hypothetical protein JKX91_15565 [Rhizobiaceae bacterium]|nr:hypothetical protein [Rhizobiaceae bacterium]